DRNILTGIADAVGALDGVQNAPELYEYYFANELRSIGDTFVSGVSGGTFWGEDHGGGVSEVVELRNVLIRKYAPNLATLSPFLVPEWRNGGMEALYEGIDESCTPLEKKTRVDISTFWNLINRQSRWGFSLNNSVRRMGLQYENPFYDSEFVAFMRRIPP